MSPPPDFFSESRPRSQGRVTGVVTGIVTSNTDPDYLGRVKLRLPWRRKNGRRPRRCPSRSPRSPPPDRIGSRPWKNGWAS